MILMLVSIDENLYKLLYLGYLLFSNVIGGLFGLTWNLLYSFHTRLWQVVNSRFLFFSDKFIKINDGIWNLLIKMQNLSIFIANTL